MVEKTNSTVQNDIKELRKQSLTQLTHYLSFALVFIFVAAIYRMGDIVWQNIYILHFVCFFSAGIVILKYKKLSYHFVVYSYLGVGVVATIVELFALGVAGAAEMIAMFCIMLALFYLDVKATVIVAGIILVFYGLAYYLFVFSGLDLPESRIHYLANSSSWFGALVIDSAFFFIIGMSIYYLQDKIIRLLLVLEAQKKTIEAQKLQIEYLANHDALTGLPSLRLADDRLNAALLSARQESHKSALLFLDLDGFKLINDTYGHKAGDEVLKAVAERIVAVIRATDTACRVGGDEFVVIIKKVEELSDLESLCDRLVKVISTPFIFEGHQLSVGVSIGAASYPCSANSARGLRAKADELMYQVKRAGKNNYLISGEYCKKQFA